MAKPQLTGGSQPGSPRPGGAEPGGAPQTVRDAAVKDQTTRPSYGVSERAGEPGDGRSAEDRTTPVLAPHIPPKGWSFGGGAIPVLLIVALLIAVVAWAL